MKSCDHCKLRHFIAVFLGETRSSHGTFLQLQPKGQMANRRTLLRNVEGKLKHHPIGGLGDNNITSRETDCTYKSCM